MPDLGRALPRPLRLTRRRRARSPVNPYRAAQTLLVLVVLAALVTEGAPAWVHYRIRPGDTVSAIAVRYHTTVQRLVAVNSLPGNGHRIYAGVTIKVPQRRARAARPAPSPAHATRTRVLRHRLRPGETLSHIAARHGHTAAWLARVNGLSNPGLVYAGQVIRVPTRVRVRRARAASHSATPARGRPARTRVLHHRMRAGETLSHVAARYGHTVRALARANRLRNPGLVYAGQVIRIPTRIRAQRRATAANSFAGRSYPHRVVSSAARNRAHLQRRRVPSRSHVRRLVVATAHRHGVDANLALAVAYQESGFNQRAVSVANAIGVMQVVPSTGRWVSGVYGRRLDLLDARDNIIAGVFLLKMLRAEADLRHAVAGYYQGLGGVRANGMYPDTKRYVASVLLLRRQFAVG